MRTIICGFALSVTLASGLAIGASFDQPPQASPQELAARVPVTYLWPWTLPGSPPAVDSGYTLAWDATELDPNGLPLNPDWSPRTGNAVPVIRPSCMHPSASMHSTCDQVSGADRATGVKLAICKVAGSPFPGHVNWGPATVTGRISWGNLADDGDDNLFLEPSAGAGITVANHTIDDDAARRYIELEFDSSETLGRMSTSGWSALNRAIVRWANEPIDSSEIDALLNVRNPGAPSRAVVSGLFGLDCEHDCPSEVHPVYALAIETNDAPDDNTWMIFARNWGNEGFCSRQIHLVDTMHVTVELPGFGSGTPSLVSSELATTDPNTPPPSVLVQSSQSIVVDFTLQAPAEAGLVELVLHLKWSGVELGPAKGAPAARPRPPFTRVQRNRIEADFEHSPLATAAPTETGRGPAARSTPAAPTAPVLRSVRRTSPITLVRRDYTRQASQTARGASEPTANLRRIETQRDAADRRMVRALCRTSGDHLEGLSAAESARVCQQARQ